MMLMGMVFPTGPAYAQTIDTTTASLPGDTLPGNLKVKGDTLSMAKEKGDIETTIKYSAKDSIRMDVVKKIVYLYGNAKINYGDITLTAALISIDWESSLMTANALPDSTGKMTGVPVFLQGGDKYEADEIKYRWDTKKGIIRNIVTQEGEGYVTGDKVKRDENAVYIKSATYTTCNLRHPHFYINARKLKVLPDDKVVSGPFNLVVSDVHTPLGFFLGFFPIPKKQKSGIIFPTFGMSAQRGLFLSRGGYYLAVNDYLNVKFMGDVYSNSSWNATLSSDYIVKYKFSGNLGFTYSQMKNSFSLSEGQQNSFNILWTHRTAMKKNRSFQANVNVYSKRFYSNNSFNPTQLNTNASSSNITYTKTFAGTPFNITVAARQDQNISGTKAIMNFTLPEVNFAMSRIYPFKKKISTGESWYEKINVAYNLSTKYFASNLPLNYGFPATSFYTPPNASASTNERSDTLNIDSSFVEVLKSGQWGARHTIPVSTTMKVMKYFNLSPTFTFNQYFYDRYLDYLTDQTPVKVRVVKGLTSTYDFNFSSNLTTRVYGTYRFRSERLRAIRHTIVPTLNYTFRPDFGDPNQFNNYELDPSTGRTLSRFNTFVYGSPSAGKVNSVGFSVTNTIEGRTKSKKDTVVKKVSLVDNISAAGSYNFEAKNKMYLSMIQLSARTRLFKLIDFNLNSTLDPYKYRKDSTVVRGATTTIYQTRLNPRSLNVAERSYGEFKRSLSFNVSLSANLNPKALKRRPAVVAPQTGNPELDFIKANPDLYLDFNIPWNLNVMYNYNYSRIGWQKANTVQTLSLSGDLRITEKWKVAFVSGYDFTRKGISTTSLTITRDLHCWQMSFNVIPFGARQSYFFTINAKSSILQDLKLNKRSPAYIGTAF
jgi:hypothetical protein